MSWARKGLACMKLGLKQSWVYIFDYLMWIAAMPIVLLVYYYLWKAIFANTSQAVIRGFTFPQMLSYYVIGTIVTVFTLTHLDKDLASKVRHGDLTRRLVRPNSFFAYKMFKKLSRKVQELIVRLIIIGLLIAFVFDISMYSWTHTLLFVASLPLCFVLAMLLTLVIGTSAFWMKNYGGIGVIRQGITSILSGAIIPVSFFPAGFQAVLKYLPFQYIRYSPVLIFNGQLTITQSLHVLGIQALWIVALYVLYRIVWHKAIKQYSGVGA